MLKQKQFGLDERTGLQHLSAYQHVIPGRGLLSPKSQQDTFLLYSDMGCAHGPVPEAPSVSALSKMGPMVKGVLWTDCTEHTLSRCYEDPKGCHATYTLLELESNPQEVKVGLPCKT